MLKDRGRQLSFGHVLEVLCLMAYEKKMIGNWEDTLGIWLLAEALEKKKRKTFYMSLIYLGIIYSANPINPENKTKKATNSKWQHKAT